MVDWRIYALGSAIFAALTAILAKVGVMNVDSNLATFVRTVVILALCSLAVTIRGGWGLGDGVAEVASDADLVGSRPRGYPGSATSRRFRPVPPRAWRRSTS